MKILRKLIIIISVIILALIFMNKTVKAFQFDSDVRVEKVWNTKEQTDAYNKMKSARNAYLKFENIVRKILIVGVILSAIIATYATARANMQLKRYYIILALLAFAYVIIERCLASVYLKNIAHSNALMYMKIFLTTIGVLIGIFAEGKIQKILMSLTPALIIFALGFIGNSVGDVAKVAFTIILFTQIILLPKYFEKKELPEQDDGIKEV